MTSSLKKLPDSKVELSVELNKEELLSYVDLAEDRLARDVQLDGFRKGKIPKDLLRQKIGAAKIREEALEIAVQTSMTKAVEKEKLEVIDKVDFKIKENSPERLSYQTIFLVFPPVKLGQYKVTNVEKKEVSVGGEEVRKVLNDVLKSRTIFNEVRRPAKMGDRIELDFIVKNQGEIIEGGKRENHPVTLGDNLFVPGFEEKVVGMEIGQTSNFSLKIPDNYYQKTIAGKELDFEVTLKKVEDKTVPKLDDDFAKSLGRFGSLVELQASVKDGLLREKTANERERRRTSVVKEIADKTSVEIPSVLVERRLEGMVQELDQDLHQKGMELGLYLAHMGKTQDELKKDWHKRAEEEVKMSLVLRAIAKEEDMRVSEKEIEGELQTVLQQYLVSRGPEALEGLKQGELKTRIYNLLLNEKVLEFLEKENNLQ